MRAAFLINISSRWKKTPPAKLTQLIQRNLTIPSEFFMVDRTQPHSLENHLTEIAKSDFDRIIVAAGDGTINRVINFLALRGLLESFILGVIPMGTCNDFAKILGFRKGPLLQRNIQLAIETIAKNIVREISVAKVNDHYFINNAGFGRRNPAHRKRGPISDLRAMKPVPTTITWDNQSLRGSFLMMLAANAPYFSNGLHFSKDSDPTDGILEFFFVKNISKFRLLTKLFLGVRGFALTRKHRSDSAVWKTKTSELNIKTEMPVWIMADGEVVPSLSEIREARFSVAGRCRFLTAK